MKLAEFDYSLPKSLIAQYPAQHRDESRMMILDRHAQSIEHRKFRDLLGYLSEGDCLVLNNTKVINARLIGKKQTGGKAEIFVLENLGNNVYKALLKPAVRLRDKKIYFRNNIHARVLKAENPNSLVEFDRQIDFSDLHRLGRIPLPPYIKRSPMRLDVARYQTVFAVNDGATAAPTAGLHFTENTLAEIEKKGISIAYVTLHSSYGTFAPVLEEDIENHKMHREYFELPAETIEKIRKKRLEGKKIIAVGTTTTRVLEANAEKVTDSSYQPSLIKGWTELFLYPGYDFKIVNALLTNFHMPKSTLLMLVSAFAGREFVLRSYGEAIKEKYRFFSYGDCMLIT